MPTYFYRCSSNHVFERYLKMKDYNEPQKCICGELGKQQIYPVKGYVRPNYDAYRSPVTGKMVNGRKQHLEDLKRTSCRLYEPGEKEELLRRKAREEVNFERKLDQVADEFIASLPAERKEKLVQEVMSGATAVVTRQ